MVSFSENGKKNISQSNTNAQISASLHCIYVTLDFKHTLYLYELCNIYHYSHNYTKICCSPPCLSSSGGCLWRQSDSKLCAGVESKALHTLVLQEGLLSVLQDQRSLKSCWTLTGPFHSMWRTPNVQTHTHIYTVTPNDPKPLPQNGHPKRTPQLFIV